MIVTRKTKITFSVEMTDEQRVDLLFLLEMCKKEGRDIIAIQAKYGEKVSDRVLETCNNLFRSLKG